MIDFEDELDLISTESDAIAQRGQDAKVVNQLSTLEKNADDAGKAWSGSWLGYHSRVYYKDLNRPPPGARFDTSDGLTTDPIISDTRGDWREYSYDELLNAIVRSAQPTLADMELMARKASNELGEIRERLLSILHAIEEDGENAYVQRLISEAENATALTANQIVQHFTPRQAQSSDIAAIQHGFMTPPHIEVVARVRAIRSSFSAADILAKLGRRTSNHLRHRKGTRVFQQRGENVFIGHGRSTAWRELKDFLQDRLGLDWDEFNRVPVAGITNISRLSQMLDEAAIAFLIMTAEDEQKDGKHNARINVVHEAGLFQGRLGFMRAIVLIEEGCEEFSNIQGLGQIHFPKNNISAAFEEVRQVLEREGLVE